MSNRSGNANNFSIQLARRFNHASSFVTLPFQKILEDQLKRDNPDITSSYFYPFSDYVIADKGLRLAMDEDLYGPKPALIPEDVVDAATNLKKMHREDYPSEVDYEGAKQAHQKKYFGNGYAHCMMIRLEKNGHEAVESAEPAIHLLYKQGLVATVVRVKEKDNENKSDFYLSVMNNKLEQAADGSWVQKPLENIYPKVLAIALKTGLIDEQRLAKNHINPHIGMIPQLRQQLDDYGVFKKQSSSLLDSDLSDVNGGHFGYGDEALAVSGKSHENIDQPFEVPQHIVGEAEHKERLLSKTALRTGL